MIEKKSPINDPEALARLHGGFLGSNLHIFHLISVILQKYESTSNSTQALSNIYKKIKRDFII